MDRFRNFTIQMNFSFIPFDRKAFVTEKLKWLNARFRNLLRLMNTFRVENISRSPQAARAGRTALVYVEDYNRLNLYYEKLVYYAYTGCKKNELLEVENMVGRSIPGLDDVESEDEGEEDDENVIDEDTAIVYNAIYGNDISEDEGAVDELMENEDDEDCDDENEEDEEDEDESESDIEEEDCEEEDEEC